jgi:ribosomal protein L17
VFWSTLKGLVLDNRRCVEQALVTDPPRMKEKKRFSKKLISFGRKDSVVSGKQIQEALLLRGRTNSLVLTGSETPWRRQKMQITANNK